MKSFNRIGTSPVSLPLLADEIVEFHIARILLLLHLCGVSGRRIDGLTKFAKLDFFARYPDFFEVAKAAVAQTEEANETTPEKTSDTVEAAMVRHHYGPWDKRYYHLLAHMEAKGLITVMKNKNTYQIMLTNTGSDHAKALASKDSFTPLVGRMKELKKTFGQAKGSYLKDLIYRLFDDEVGKKPMGEVIQ